MSVWTTTNMNENQQKTRELTITTITHVELWQIMVNHCLINLCYRMDQPYYSKWLHRCEPTSKAAAYVDKWRWKMSLGGGGGILRSMGKITGYQHGWEPASMGNGWRMVVDGWWVGTNVWWIVIGWWQWTLNDWGRDNSLQLIEHQQWKTVVCQILRCLMIGK